MNNVITMKNDIAIILDAVAKSIGSLDAEGFNISKKEVCRKKVMRAIIAIESVDWYIEFNKHLDILRNDFCILTSDIVNDEVNDIMSCYSLGNDNVFDIVKHIADLAVYMEHISLNSCKHRYSLSA